MTKPFSEACDRNKQPILEVLQHLLKDTSKLLEIGSGTGQHAVYFSQHMPHLLWQTSDLLNNHFAINLWVDEAENKNLLKPLELNVTADQWPADRFEAVFTANTVHIMPWEAVVAMIEGVASLLETSGLFVVYGPFNYNGQFTSESNARFEEWLKAQALHQGIRDFEHVNEQAQKNGLHLLDDIAMPANNRILVFEKRLT